MTVWTVPAIIIAVTDGDTLRASLDLGWKITYDAKIRLAGINCPEMSTPEGPAARAFTVNWLNSIMPVGDDGPLSAPVTVVSRSLDKYGRVLADIYAPYPGGPKGVVPPLTAQRHLNADLLTAGHAQVMK